MVNLPVTFLNVDSQVWNLAFV